MTMATKSKKVEAAHYAKVSLDASRSEVLLNVREEKSLDSKILRTLTNGIRVKYFEDKSDDEWLAIECEHVKLGYSMRKYFEIGR